jgi:hypothetical protein
VTPGHARDTSQHSFVWPTGSPEHVEDREADRDPVSGQDRGERTLEAQDEDQTRHADQTLRVDRAAEDLGQLAHDG